MIRFVFKEMSIRHRLDLVADTQTVCKLPGWPEVHGVDTAESRLGSVNAH